MEEFLKHCMVHHPGSCKLHTTLLAKHTPGSIPVPASRIQVHDQRSRNGNTFNPWLNSIYHAIENRNILRFFFISILVPTYLVLKMDNDFVDFWLALYVHCGLLFCCWWWCYFLYLKCYSKFMNWSTFYFTSHER